MSAVFFFWSEGFSPIPVGAVRAASGLLRSPAVRYPAPPLFHCLGQWGKRVSISFFSFFFFFQMMKGTFDGHLYSWIVRRVVGVTRQLSEDKRCVNLCPKRGTSAGIVRFPRYLLVMLRSISELSDRKSSPSPLHLSRVLK